MKQNNAGKCLFLITNVNEKLMSKLMTFFEGELFPLIITGNHYTDQKNTQILLTRMSINSAYLVFCKFMGTYA